MNLVQIVILAIIQGAAELLPVSSSAHVILAEKLMGLDPSAPEMTFLLVMLHCGTMFSVLLYFWPRWKKLDRQFFKMIILATAVTGFLGLGLKKIIETILGVMLTQGMVGLPNEMNGSPAARPEIEHLFKNLPLMAFSLFSVGVFMIFADYRTRRSLRRATHPTLEPQKMDLPPVETDRFGTRILAREGASTESIQGIRAVSATDGLSDSISSATAAWIGAIQGVCLPFRGFSRSGATISAALLRGLSRETAENFSFALAVILTPPVVAREFYRLLKASGVTSVSSLTNDTFLSHINMMVSFLAPGLIGMIFSFASGILALRWLSAWLENGRWKYFGIYCIAFSLVVLCAYSLGA